MIENDGRDIMEKVIELNYEVNINKKEIEKTNQKIDNHMGRDHEKFEELTNAIVEIKEMQKEARESSTKSQENTNELIMSVKDLAVAIRGETVEKLHNLEKDIIGVKHGFQVADLKQDLKSVNKSPKSSKTKIIEFLKLPYVSVLLGGLAVFVLVMLEQKFGVKITP